MIMPGWEIRQKENFLINIMQISSQVRSYEIPIQMTIPEKVSGIRPSGKYTITVNLLLQGKTVDTKIVTTQVI